MSILAGIMIAIGCLAYLQLGGMAGAILFSLGLMSVIYFKLKLFTGQSYKLTTGEIKWWQLILIWIGNFIGAAAIAFAARLLLNSTDLQEIAGKFIQARAQVGYLGNFILAIPCGMLMTFAVTANKEKQDVIYTAFCVAGFIMCGFYHCVADMFYAIFSGNLTWSLLFVTLGNVVGCNLFPIVKIVSEKVKKRKK